MSILFELGISEDFWELPDDGQTYDLDEIIEEVKSWDD